MEKLETTKAIVRKVLERDEATRNSDTWLIIQVLREMGFKVFLEYDRIKDMPSFESIRRSRQFWQNTKGKFKPTQKVAEQREERQEEFKEVFT